MTPQVRDALRQARAALRNGARRSDPATQLMAYRSATAWLIEAVEQLARQDTLVLFDELDELTSAGEFDEASSADPLEPVVAAS
jgi:hypothetical protein